jgi:hypothetical protein
VLAPRLDAGGDNARRRPARKLELDGGNRQVLDPNLERATARRALDRGVLGHDATQVIARPDAPRYPDREWHDCLRTGRERHLCAVEPSPGTDVAAGLVARKIYGAARLTGRRVDRVQVRRARSRTGVDDPHLVCDRLAGHSAHDEVGLRRGQAALTAVAVDALVESVCTGALVVNVVDVIVTFQPVPDPVASLTVIGRV